MTLTVQEAKIVRKPSLYATLKEMELRVPQRFSVRQFKVGNARTAVSELRKKGYDFEITEAGMIDEYVITRLK